VGCFESDLQPIQEFATGPAWKLRSDFVSPRYTTAWEDLQAV